MEAGASLNDAAEQLFGEAGVAAGQLLRLRRVSVRDGRELVVEVLHRFGEFLGRLGREPLPDGGHQPSLHPQVQ